MEPGELLKICNESVMAFLNKILFYAVGCHGSWKVHQQIAYLTSPARYGLLIA